MKHFSVLFLFSLCTANILFPGQSGRLLAQQTAPASHVSGPSPVKRMLRPGDIYRLPAIGDAQVSPDGKWVAYNLTTVDSVKDKRSSSIWMVSWDGSQSLQLTNSPEGESRPRWSPDGKYLSFLSSRQANEPAVKGGQIWLMDRRGGEGKRLTEIKGGVNDYAWSPDSKKLLLTLTDQEAEDTSKAKTTKPYVIDRYHYKQDVEGYRYKKLYSHLYLFDVATKKIDTLTRGKYDEGSAVWSSDGSRIAFVSNRTEDPDRNENSDIFVMDARPGAIVRQLTTWKGTDNSPRWSPDGKYIAYTRSTTDADYIMYDQPVLCVISSEGGEPRLLTRELDRPVNNPRWSADGKSIMALVTDDRQELVAAFPAVGGNITRIADGERAFHSLETGPSDRLVVTMSIPQLPTEIYALENGTPRRLTTHMNEFLAPLTLATVEGFSSNSADGTLVSGILFKPPTISPAPVAPGSKASSGGPSSASGIGGQAGSPQKLPLILFIHGGPVGQDGFGFDLTRQMLAAGGYAVAAVNYRGSNGRGLDYCKIISGDWGNKEVVDLHGAVDYLVNKGIVDSGKLGVGGWSYGGILTDYLIASDTRFKAACSGAGTGFTISFYGVDQYITQYDNEIGAPWKYIDRYLKLSYPFLKADRIKTPTLFLSGEKDFNVPSSGSEQMYQALRSIGIPTQLIIYPGQFHGISVPSYQKDRMERYLAWYDRYLKNVRE